MIGNTENINILDVINKLTKEISFDKDGCEF